MDRQPEDSRESPDEAGVDKAAGEVLDAVVSRHADSRVGPVPGAVVLVARHGTVALHRAYGQAQTHRDGEPLEVPRPMRPDTVFDVASVTKIAVTTPALMRLVADELVELDAPVSALLPVFSGEGKAGVLVRDLLSHRAGLWEWWPLYLEASGREEAIAAAAELPLRYRVGEARRYSDLSMILAGAIIEAVTGERLDAYARRTIFEPLGMRATGFLPSPELRLRCAATSTGNSYEQHMLATGDPYPTGRRATDFHRWRTHTLVGEAKDGNAHYALRGVGGHAGLFSTASDLARLGQMLLDHGAYRGAQVLPEEVVRECTSPGVDDRQGLGFWTNRRAEVGLGRGGFGHGGFTGAQLFAEPETDLVVVLLTNRTHCPLPYPSIEPLWRDVLATVTASLAG
ncbi:MAG: serine hydrolase domain-containing protein [Actinomycetota bacterium]